MQLAHVYRKLEEGSKRLTPQREIIIQIFLEHPGEHLSAEDVHRLIHNDQHPIGLATVYRTLELLTGLSVLRCISFGDGRSRYEFNQEELHRHHHMVCLRCGRVEEFAEDLLEALEGKILEQRGFRVMDHELKFYGICQYCQKKTGTARKNRGGQRGT